MWTPCARAQDGSSNARGSGEADGRWRPIAPAEAVKPVAEPAEVKVSPQILPVAATESATEEMPADTVTAAAPGPVSAVVVSEPEPSEPAAATIRLERKHPLAIRWMHWVNFPVLFTMIWSGLLIYWNDSDNAYQHPHAVYRVGVGSLTLVRLFPPWFWKAINAPYRVTEGLGYHFFFMWLFAINGILYVSYLLISGEWRLLVPERRSIRDAIQVTLVDLASAQRVAAAEEVQRGAEDCL